MKLELTLKRALAALASLLVIGSANAGLFESAPGDLSRESILGARDGKLLVVLFEQQDCESCARLRSSVLNDKTAEQGFSKRYRTVAVNLTSTDPVTTPDGNSLPRKEWAQRLRVVGTPAIAFFDANGRLRYRHLGTLANGRELQLLGDYVASAAYERVPFANFVAAQRIGARVDSAQKDALCHTRS